jgi:hypothetical protein
MRRGGRGPVDPYYADYPAEALPPADEMESLRGEADFLEKRLKSISRRIEELESNSSKENG